MTNAVRAQIIVVVNTVLALAISLGASLTDGQTAAIVAATNAVLGLWVALTYHKSPYREIDQDDV